MTRNRVCFSILVILSDAGPEHPGTEHCDDTADVMNLCRACEIMESELLKPAASPAPVSADRIDDERDHCGINTVSLEVRALSHRSGDDRRCCRAEHRLENNVAPERHRLRDHAVLRRIRAADQKVRCSDESTEPSVEHDRETDQPEAGGSDTEIHHVFHENIACILRPGKACLAERKSGLHEIDQRCREEHPCNSVHIYFHNCLPPSIQINVRPPGAQKDAEALLFRVSTPLSIRIGSKSLSGFPLRTKRLSFHISYKYGKIVYHYTQLFQ